MTQPQLPISAVDLITEVEGRIEKVRTRSLDVSFNELLDMHSTGELIIDPEYQRLFRWSLGQQSRFVESLILEMPVPPIFVIEIEDGRYELIDGLQRVSSYLHFRGKLPSHENQYLTLTDCDIALGLNGRSYDDLPQSIQIKLKRNFVRLEVIRKESDPKLRYYMFKRLNRGGSLLSDQEIRNCTIRLLDSTFNSFVIDLSLYEHFRECIANVSIDQVDQKYDHELVLRFFAFKNAREKYKHEIGDFLTDYLEFVSDPEAGASRFNYDQERALFTRTFAVLARALGSKVFAGQNRSGTDLIESFLIYHFEAFSLGIQRRLADLDPSNDALMGRLGERLREIKLNAQFIAMTTGGGKNYPKPLAARIEFVEAAVQDVT